MRFEKVAIVGVGLIGGSFAMAAKEAGIARRITGDDTPEVLAEATRRGIVDGAEKDWDADLVFVAAPVSSIIEFLRTRGPLLKPGTLVTDAGSTKRDICLAAKTVIERGVHFVGGHPMAGSQERGLAHARKDLFCGAPYAITVNGDQESPSTSACDQVAEIARRIGARPVFVTPEVHDRAVAAVSHVPQLLATALAAVVSEVRQDATLDLTGPGFADMTRLASSPWTMWRDICSTNGPEIAEVLDRVARLLAAMRDDLAGQGSGTVGDAFSRANQFLRELPGKNAESLSGKP